MRKYGLSERFVRLDGIIYTDEEMKSYNQMVQICHDFVESWWDAHPQDIGQYYKSLEKASPEWSAKVFEWSKENERRVNARRVKMAEWDEEAEKRAAQIKEKRGLK